MPIYEIVALPLGSLRPGIGVGPEVPDGPLTVHVNVPEAVPPRTYGAELLLEPLYTATAGVPKVQVSFGLEARTVIAQLPQLTTPLAVTTWPM
jgi:hypothetical protein